MAETKPSDATVPKVKLGGEDEGSDKDTGEDVDAIDLIVAESSGPIVELSLPANHRWKSEGGVNVMGLIGARATLAWEDQTLEFCVSGFRSTPGGRDLLVGIVLPKELLNWFEGKPTDEHAVQTLIYQRQEDANGWDFVRRVLGERFAVPHGAIALDEALPVGTCVLRAAGCDNLAHLQRVLGLLTTLPTRAWGWCAFDTEQGEDPLRLLGLDAPVLNLDESWAPSDLTGVHLPHRAAGDSSGELSRSFGELETKKAAALVRQLSRAGIELAAEELLEDADQLPCLPGQIGIGELTALCYRIRYAFDLGRNADNREDKHVEFKTHLSFRPLPGTPGLSASSVTLRGFFSDWDEASERTRIQMLPGATAKEPSEVWRLMGDSKSNDQDTPDPEKPLIGISVTPFRSRGDFAGFYVSHQESDPMLVQVRDLEVPTMIGMQQVYAEGLEGVDLVLNSPTVSISGLAQSADLATADGVAVDGAAGTVEVFADQHVRLKQKVTTTDDSTVMEHNAKVTGKAEIEGDTKIGGKTDIEGDTTIAATLEVGS